MKAAKTLTVYLTLVLTSQTLVLAQNPLRAAPQDDYSSYSRAQFNAQQNSRPAPPTRDHAGIDNARRLSESFDLPANIQLDAQVVPASYDQVDRELMAGGYQPGKTTGGTAFGDRESPGPGGLRLPTDRAQEQQPNTSVAGMLGAMSGGPMDHNQILNLLMKISINLAFVLSFAVGVILIARRWVKPGQTSSAKERAVGDSLSIRETLRLDNKMSIRLVQWRSNRFLVACDQNGIQSVHSLSASFEQTIRELDDHSIDENLIRKFIAGMDSGRAAA